MHHTSEPTVSQRRIKVKLDILYRLKTLRWYRSTYEGKWSRGMLNVALTIVPRHSTVRELTRNSCLAHTNIGHGVQLRKFSRQRLACGGLAASLNLCAWIGSPSCALLRHAKFKWCSVLYSFSLNTTFPIPRFPQVWHCQSQSPNTQDLLVLVPRPRPSLSRVSASCGSHTLTDWVSLGVAGAPESW